MTMHRSSDTPLNAAGFGFSSPAIYRVVVQGTLADDWWRRLGGMEVTPPTEKGGAPCTILRGQMDDQAALHGLLETLYALHLPILEVTKEEG